MAGFVPVSEAIPAAGDNRPGKDAAIRIKTTITPYPTGHCTISCRCMNQYCTAVAAERD